MVWQIYLVHTLILAIYLAFRYKCYFTIGEKLYVGCLMDTNPGIAVQRMQPVSPGIITPSQDSFTFCDYNSYEDELPLKTVRVDEMPCHVLTSKIPGLLYWEPAEKFTFNCSLPRNVVKLESVVRDDPPCLFFIALVPPTVVHDGKVIGHYDKAKFPADFNGSLVGAGQAWLDDCWENAYTRNFYDYQYSSYNVNVFYDGKIIEAPSFSFLCAHEIPKLSHYTLPELKWEIVADGPLPTNALPAGIFPNGEILYVGKNRISYIMMKFQVTLCIQRKAFMFVGIVWSTAVMKATVFWW